MNLHTHLQLVYTCSSRCTSSNAVSFNQQPHLTANVRDAIGVHVLMLDSYIEYVVDVSGASVDA